MAGTEENSSNQKEYNRKRSQRWRDSHPGYGAAAAKKHYHEHRTEILIAQKEKYKANPDYKRNLDLIGKLGITLSDSQSENEFQKNLCAICGRLMKRPCNDHDHRTGLYRGQLCWNCNSGLGKFGDNLEHLANAIVYLAYPVAVRALGKPIFGLPGRATTSKRRRKALQKKVQQVFVPIDLRPIIGLLQKTLDNPAQL